MEKILFQEGIFEFVSNEKNYDIDGESRTIKRNFVRRPPGVKVFDDLKIGLIIKNPKLYTISYA